jgi:hypothetical protein
LAGRDEATAARNRQSAKNSRKTTDFHAMVRTIRKTGNSVFIEYQHCTHYNRKFWGVDSTYNMSAFEWENAKWRVD